MEHGPVDVVVLAIGEPHFDGSILGELEKLAASGTIRVLDAMVLMKTAEGVRVSLDIEDMPAEDAAKLGFVETGTKGMFDAEDADTLFEGMAPGSAVVAVAIENAWAVPLMNSMMESGAELAMTWRVPAPLVDDAFAALRG